MNRLLPHRSLALGLTLAIVMAGAASAQATTPAAVAQPAPPAVTSPAPQPALPAAPAAAAPDTVPSLPATEDNTPPADLSVRGMISHASWVVQAVLALLGAASVVTWTFLLGKAIELIHANRKIRQGVAMAEADAPDSEQGMPHPLLTMRAAVHAELAASTGATPDGTKDRLASRLHRLEMRFARQAQRGTGILATIGATSPFVGLFGTVWGIMNSFVGIARLHTTNLAVVAPGIAEALLATAAGLVVAIPAVVSYNILVRWIAAYRHGLGDLGEIVLRHTARILDKAPPVYPERGRLAAE